jgi:outer membrane lipoprotein-sorting protein
MPEFKFSCPQCGQRIECDTAYAGAQINCPSCQQAIIVPQAAAPAVPPALPQSTPPIRAGTAAPMAARSPAPAPSAKKSHTLRNVLVITACVVFVLLAGLGALAWMGYSKFKAAQLAVKKGNPAAMVAAPSVAQQQGALDLLAKMQGAYTNLSSFQASGTSVMDIDMSQITAADVDPKASKTAKSHRSSFLPKTITSTMEVSIKLQRPDLYCVRENSHTAFGFTTMSNSIVSWSPGQTNYTYMRLNNGTFKRFVTAKDRGTTLMSGGQPCLLALGAMQLFFNDTVNTPKLIKDLGQTEDATINGQDCYTLTAKLFGQKLKIWVNKSNYMILQSQLTLGAPISDEDFDAAFDSFNTKTNMTAVEITKQKAQAKQQLAMISKIRGTITDTCDDVQPNPALTADDFSYRVPRGTKLVAGQ